MIKTTLLGSALAVALSAGPAIAADFHALEGLQGVAPASLQDGVLAATEGGATCNITPDVGAVGAGAAYCGFVIGASGSTSGTPVGVDIPLTANILNVSVP